MSAQHDTARAHGAHDADHGHGDGGHPTSHPHGTIRTYLLGFILAALLTAIPFWLVMTGAIVSVGWTTLIIFALAIVQIVVHVVFFLHLDTRGEGGWTLISFIFTVVIVGIVIGGTIWVMFHLNANMMPSMSMETSPPQ